MTTVRNDSAEIVQHLKATKRPVVVTVNGKAAAVVQDAKAYQRLLDLAAQASAPEGSGKGWRTWRAGAPAVLACLRRYFGRHCISR